jgi:hypothetical protein
VGPSISSAEAWYTNDFPDPVGETSSTSRPSSSDTIACSWPGSREECPKCSAATRRTRCAAFARRRFPVMARGARDRQHHASDLDKLDHPAV